MYNKKERNKYKSLFEELFKKTTDLSEEKEEVEFNIELIKLIASKYREINEEKKKLNISNYYNQEEIRLNIVIKQLENRKYDDTIISKSASAIVPIITFGLGILLTLGNEGIRNALSQVVKVEDSVDVIRKNIETIGGYTNDMSNIVIKFVLVYTIAIAIIFYLEYFINNRYRMINERKIRFCRTCLEVLKKIDGI